MHLTLAHPPAHSSIPKYSPAHSSACLPACASLSLCCVGLPVSLSYYYSYCSHHSLRPPSSRLSTLLRLLSKSPFRQSSRPFCLLPFDLVVSLSSPSTNDGLTFPYYTLPQIALIAKVEASPSTPTLLVSYPTREKLLIQAPDPADDLAATNLLIIVHIIPVPKVDPTIAVQYLTAHKQSHFHFFFNSIRP